MYGRNQIFRREFAPSCGGKPLCAFHPTPVPTATIAAFSYQELYDCVYQPPFPGCGGIGDNCNQVQYSALLADYVTTTGLWCVTPRRARGEAATSNDHHLRNAHRLHPNSHPRLPFLQYGALPPSKRRLGSRNLRRRTPITR